MVEAREAPSDGQDLRLHRFNEGFVWRDTPRDGLRRLTTAEVERFDRDGFFVLHGLFTPEEIAAVTAAIDPLERAEAERVEREHGGRHVISQTGAISFTIHLVTRSPVLAAFAAHPSIKDVCHDLIGDDVRLYWDQSVYKKTEVPRDFPWHQDNGYAFLEPQQYLTLWIPLVDVDETNGCPWIAPGLHRFGTLRHWPTEIGLVCLERFDGAAPAPARAGDVVVFSSLAPHRTGPNLSASDRKAYILQYAPEGAAVRTREGQSVAQTDPARQFPILRGGR